MAASHASARNLIAIVDRNEHCLDGRVDDIVSLEPLAARWEAFGWSVSEVDGHDPAAVLGALRGIVADEQRNAPAVLIAHTVKGKGVSYMESEIGWHLGYLVGPRINAGGRIGDATLGATLLLTQYPFSAGR